MTVREIIKLELNTEVIKEAITKAQKEAGQRWEESNNISPILNIKKDLDKKWSKLKDRKNPQRDLEYYRFWLLIKEFEKQKEINNGNIEGIIKVLTKQEPKWGFEKSSSGRTGFGTGNDTKPKILFDLNSLYKEDTNGFHFNDAKELGNLIPKFKIFHEYGHVYSMLKNYIETGNVQIPKTELTQASKNEEGKANIYSLKNMYRKDRNKLVDKAEEYTKYVERMNKNGISVPKETFKGTDIKDYMDHYYKGTMENSNGFIEKIKESIKKENDNKIHKRRK